MDVDRLKARLALLDSEFAGADAEVQRFTERLEEARERRSRINGRRDMLKELIVEVGGVPIPRSIPQEGAKPRQAALELVRVKPGITTREVVEELEGRVVTTASNERHMLRTTLSNLVKEGKVVKRDGKYYVSED